MPHEQEQPGPVVVEGVSLCMGWDVGMEGGEIRESWGDKRTHVYEGSWIDVGGSLIWYIGIWGLGSCVVWCDEGCELLMESDVQEDWTKEVGDGGVFMYL